VIWIPSAFGRWLSRLQIRLFELEGLVIWHGVVVKKVGAAPPEIDNLYVVNF
jgi:hypothetical protein